MLGVFRSSDGGDSGEEISGTHFEDEGQISYNNTIVVHPTDHNYVICGGVDLHLTKDGGDDWRRMTHWDAIRGDANYAHSDHHCVLMPAAAPGLVYDANDGGLDVSEDGGAQLGESQRRSGDHDVLRPRRSPERTARFLAAARRTMERSSRRLARLTSSSRFTKVTAAGWFSMRKTKTTFIARATTWTSACTAARSIGMFRRELRKTNGIRFGCVTSHSILQTRNACSRDLTECGAPMTMLKPGTSISPKLDGSPITAIEVAPADPRYVYVGTENGGFFRSLNRGGKWSPNLSSSILPGHTITRLESHPTERNDCDRDGCEFRALACLSHARWRPDLGRHRQRTTSRRSSSRRDNSE